MHAVRYLKMSDHRYILRSSAPLTLDNWNFNLGNSISQCKRQKFHPVNTDLQSDIVKHVHYKETKSHEAKCYTKAHNIWALNED